MLVIVVANIMPAEAAHHFMDAGVGGTAIDSVGFSPAWGIERGARIEFADPRDAVAAERATVELLKARKEDCALMVRDDVAGLLYADGVFIRFGHASMLAGAAHS